VKEMVALIRHAGETVQARIGDRGIRGCDFLHTDENGLIDDFSVMVRPLTRA
jgi:hypothetical protein